MGEEGFLRSNADRLAEALAGSRSVLATVDESERPRRADAIDHFAKYVELLRQTTAATLMRYSFKREFADGRWDVAETELPAEPPLQIARVAADIAELAQEVASRADQRLRPDALAAAALASAVARACAELVAVNLTATEDDPRVREAHSHAEAAQRAAATAFAA